MCLLCKKIKNAKDQDVLFTLLKVYKPSTCPILRCKNHKEESLYFRMGIFMKVIGKMDYLMVKVYT